MFKTIRELGQGSFGVVTLVKSDQDEYYACKKITDTIDILVGIRETDALLRVNHSDPHVVKLHDYKLTTEDETYIIQQYLEFCSEGSLEELLDREFKSPDQGVRFPLGGIRQRVENLCNIAGSLAFLQTRGIYHMDVKTDNIIYRRQGGMCLCDFSNYYLKTSWKEGMQAPLIPLESLMYRPPEVGFMKNSWEGNEKTDVWAFGVILLETLGSWEFVQEVDRIASEKGSILKDLADKIKIMQTVFIKRNGRMNFKTPFRIMFGDLGRDDQEDDFGKNFANESSPEFEMILSGFYAKEYSKTSNLHKALDISKEYFRLRKETSDHDLLETVWATILTRIFQINHEVRITMKEVYETLCNCLGRTPDSHSPLLEQASDIGLWDRIPDPIWKECFERFFEDSKEVRICYGKNKDYPIPLNSILFSKHLSEDVIEKLIMGMDNEYLIPTDHGERREFYSMVLSACMLLSSEFMDFIFPVQECSWFANRPLCDVAPYLKLCGGVLLGKIGDSIPTLAEKQVMLGRVTM